MIPVAALWLPILVSAAFVFILSSIIHMALNYHANDFKKLPDEDAVADALRKFNIPPGDYAYPKPSSMKEIKTPEFEAKMKKGPMLFMTIWGGGDGSMNAQLVQWFLYSVAVGIFAAYVAGRALTAEAHYLAVFRFVGVTAFVGYAVAGWQQSIWYRKPWGVTLKNTFDGLLYALVTAGTFGWLWPR